MALIATKSEITKFFENEQNRRNYLPREFRGYRRGYPHYEHISVDEFIQKIEEASQRYVFLGKQIRPWFIRKPDEYLNPTKIWVGFEMETGFKTQEACDEAVRWFSKNMRRGAYDCEGSGRYPIEFTVSPVHLEDMEFGSGMAKMIRRIGNDPQHSNHTPGQMIGTHLNISTPKTRKGIFSANRDSIYEALEDCLGAPDLRLLFGRGKIYNPEPLWQDKYYECKFFNSTYDVRVWFGYCKVIRLIAKLFDAPYMAPEDIAEQFLALIPEIKELRETTPIKAANIMRRYVYKYHAQEVAPQPSQQEVRECASL